MVLLIQAYGHNRARQREKLGNLLDELGELQAEVGWVFMFFVYWHNSTFCGEVDKNNHEIEPFEKN